MNNIETTQLPHTRFINIFSILFLGLKKFFSQFPLKHKSFNFDEV